MLDSATITREQLRTVYIATELGGKTGDFSHFSYAKLGSSTYSFGQLQFDVGKSDSTKDFLRKNGFDSTDIHDLGQHGGLSRERLDVLDAKLQAIPQAKIDRFTNDQLDKKIADVDHAIDLVRTQNPANADAIIQDQKLQLGLADYANQFGSITPQLVEVMKGSAETLHATGIIVQAGNPPTREDIQTFIDATKYGHNNARAVAGRAGRFNNAMSELGLAPAKHAHSHASGKTNSVLELGAHGDAVSVLQTDLAALGYTDNRGQTLQPDGDYGRNTEAAVKAFQGDHGLPVDGVAGKNTLDTVQNQRHLLGPIPALAPEMEGNPHPRFDSTDPANRAPLERDSHTRDLPDAPQSAINPYTDPRNLDHGLYAELKGRIPEAGEKRLAQITAACHMSGIRSGEVGQIQFRGDDALMIAPNGGPGRGAEVALTSPAPSLQQTMQQVQGFDQQQQQQLQIAQMTAQQTQMQSGPVIGGPGPSGQHMG
jgi:peptidoglycan hydrolase-like protein with peptidoglycan-binding domain